jgi:hypothetical protein
MNTCRWPRISHPNWHIADTCVALQEAQLFARRRHVLRYPNVKFGT